jgi:hypothetical protein
VTLKVSYIHHKFDMFKKGKKANKINTGKEYDQSTLHAGMEPLCTINIH